VVGVRLACRPVDQVSTGRDYLRRANGHLRKSVIAFACLNSVMALPVADSTRFGRPIANSLGLRPASNAVRDILFQDHALAAWIARDCVVALDALLRTMGEPLGVALETAMAAAGLWPGPTVDPDARLSEPERTEALVLAHRVIAMFFAFERTDGRRGGDRIFYERLFATRSPGAAYEIAAWAGAVVGRLRGAGHLPDLPWMSAEFHTVPPMRGSGWYPNPYLMGEILAGEASWQRYWNGTDWTDRIRRRCLTGWQEQTKSLFEAPPN
jgi:hypothetical protein